jgi:hypothetical protein
LVTELDSKNLSVDGVVSTDNFFDGIAGCATSSSVFTNLVLARNHAAGLSFDMSFDGNTISHALLLDNRDDGIFMRHSNGNLFSGIAIQSAGNYGVFLAAVDEPESNCADNNEFRDLSVVGSKSAGFRINDACTGNTLTGKSVFLKNQGGCLSMNPGAQLRVFGLSVCE